MLGSAARACAATSPPVAAGAGGAQLSLRSALPRRRGPCRRARLARDPAPDLGAALLDAPAAAARQGAARPPAPGVLARQLAVRLPRLLRAAPPDPRLRGRGRAVPAVARADRRGRRAAGAPAL